MALRLRLHHPAAARARRSARCAAQCSCRSGQARMCDHWPRGRHEAIAVRSAMPCQQAECTDRSDARIFICRSGPGASWQAGDRLSAQSTRSTAWRRRNPAYLTRHGQRDTARTRRNFDVLAVSTPASRSKCNYPASLDHRPYRRGNAADPRWHRVPGAGASMQQILGAQLTDIQTGHRNRVLARFPRQRASAPTPLLRD